MSSCSVIHKLPYFVDSAALFAPYAKQAWAVFLDSGYPRSRQGRYDILSANPICTFVADAGITTISNANETLISTENSFDLLKSELIRYGELFSSQQTEIELPFNGGAMGYFSYDLARRLEN
jgi:para-aminobenzoate synthetase component 1